MFKLTRFVNISNFATRNISEVICQRRQSNCDVHIQLENRFGLFGADSGKRGNHGNLCKCYATLVGVLFYEKFLFLQFIMI